MIKRYDAYNANWEQLKDGRYVLYSDHLAAIKEANIAALTAKPGTLTNYHNPENITFTEKKKTGNVLVTTCRHDPLANAIPCATCALEQIANLAAEAAKYKAFWEQSRMVDRYNFEEYVWKGEK